MSQLEELRKKAPHLQGELLKQLLKATKSKGDEDRPAAILCTLHKDALVRNLGAEYIVLHVVQRGVVTPVKVQTEEGIDGFHIEDKAFLHVEKSLSQRLYFVFTASSHSCQLLDNIDFGRDTLAVQQILEGAYVFPDDCGVVTRLLF